MYKYMLSMALFVQVFVGCSERGNYIDRQLVEQFSHPSVDLRLDDVISQVGTARPSVDHWRRIVAKCGCGNTSLDYWCHCLIRALLLDSGDDVDAELFQAIKLEIDSRPEFRRFFFLKEFENYIIDADSLNEFDERDERFLLRVCDWIDSCGATSQGKAKFAVLLFNGALIDEDWMEVVRHKGELAAWNQIRREIYRYGDYYCFNWTQRAFRVDKGRLERREPVCIIDQEPIDPAVGVVPSHPQVRLLRIPQ